MLTTSFNINEKLYESHLTNIKNVKFTFREIDIIACIIHNRGEKKISSLLLVSPKTVSAHVYNIMNKLGCNSKDQIIDFIENSGKLDILKEYYLHLIIRANFEKLLIKIGSTINRQGIKCYATKEESLETDSALYQSIVKHLKLANIELEAIQPNEKPEENIKLFPIKNVTEQFYFEGILSSLPQIIESQNLSAVIEEFNEFYKQIIEGKKNIENISEESKKVKHLPLKIAAITIFLAMFILAGYFVWRYTFYKEATNTTDTINNTVPKIIADLEQFLEEVTKSGFTSNNADIEKMKANQNLVKKIEKLLDYKNTEEVSEYFSKAEMDSKFLVDYVYNLQTLASYYMYHICNDKKARDILLYAKNLIENYANTRSSIKVKFEDLSPEEIFAELNIAQNILEMYTRTVYSLGRTYIYSKNILDGKKYFELSKYLGRKLGLYEGYLSDTCGLLTITQKSIEQNLTSDKEANMLILNEVIAKYSLLKQDNNKYITDYNPALLKQIEVIPSEHLYNSFICNAKIIECYKDLVELTSDSKQILSYIESIKAILEKGFTKEQKSLAQIIKQLPLKRLAGLYNTLGNLYLLFDIKDINDTSMISTIKQIADFSDNTKENNLFIAEILFNKARSLSRSTDSIKADAYDGLIKLYKRKLSTAQNMSKEEIMNLENEIKNLTDKKEKINSVIERN